MQPVYAWYSVVLAARTNDSSALERALDEYARRGLGGDLSSPVFDSVRLQPWFAAAREQHDRLRAPTGRSTVVATWADSTLWPEGADFDSTTGTYYVTSVRHGTIYTRDAAGTERALWQPGSRRLGAVSSR